MEMTEKQGKKLLFECENDFRNIVDKIFIQHGKLVIRDFQNLLKFGLNGSQGITSPNVNGMKLKVENIPQ